jgi:lipopolysaccharide export system permease protein
MKTLDRYVLRELVIPFLIGTFFVVLMFQANMVIYLLKSAPPQSVPLAALAQIVMYKTPEFLNMTLPVGMSLAASMAISRLTRETELTAMRSAGAPILRVILPVAVFGLLVAVANFLVVEKVMPRASKKARDVMTQANIMAAIPEFRSNVTFNIGNYTGNFGTVSRNKESTVAWFTDVLLLERPRIKEFVVYTAETGEYRQGLFVLRKAKMWRFVDERVQKFEMGKDVPINERIAIPDIFLAPEDQEQTAEELLQTIREGRKIGRDVTSTEVAYQTRFSVPASCLIFAVVAPLFAVGFARSGAFVGVLLSLVLVLAYYNVYVISTEIFGRNALLSPFLSAWLPNFLFLVLGVIGIRRLE